MYFIMNILFEHTLLQPPKRITVCLNSVMTPYLMRKSHLYAKYSGGVTYYNILTYLISTYPHTKTSYSHVSPILWACYRIHQQFNSQWLLHIRSILNHCGLSYIYDEVSRLEPAEVILGVKERLYDQYLQQWREDITHSRKMRTYQIFKLNYNLEPYLFLPSHLRTAVARFRTSCHSLAIETGRYTRPLLPPEKRVCQTCEVMEDEKHFLLNCSSTQSLPEYKHFLSTCEREIQGFTRLSADAQFKTVMSCPNYNVIFSLAKLIHVAFKNR